MLADALVCANVPTTDLQRARRFYRDALGLPETEADGESAYFLAGGRKVLHVYEREGAAPDHTVAVFLVTDVEAEMAELRDRGVSFVDYDTPGLKTENGLFSDESGFKAAWIKDPDGNVLSLEQPPKA